MTKTIIESILDPLDNSIIKITDNFGEVYSFNQVAVLEVSLRMFTILELIDDTEPESIVFELNRVADEEIELTIVPDDVTIDMVFQEYDDLSKNNK